MGSSVWSDITKDIDNNHANNVSWPGCRGEGERSWEQLQGADQDSDRQVEAGINIIMIFQDTLVINDFRFWDDIDDSSNDDVVRDLEEKTLQAEARAEFAEKSVMKLQAEVRPW